MDDEVTVLFNTLKTGNVDDLKLQIENCENYKQKNEQGINLLQLAYDYDYPNYQTNYDMLKLLFKYFKSIYGREDMLIHVCNYSNEFSLKAFLENYNDVSTKIDEQKFIGLIYHNQLAIQPLNDFYTDMLIYTIGNPGLCYTKQMIHNTVSLEDYNSGKRLNTLVTYVFLGNFNKNENENSCGGNVVINKNDETFDSYILANQNGSRKIKLFIENGADINRDNILEKSALMGNVDEVKFLIEHNALTGKVDLDKIKEKMNYSKFKFQKDDYNTIMKLLV
jgi:hypothetical protein